MTNWIKKNKRFLRIRRIEKELGMPPSTLQKEVDGSQKMSGKWLAPLKSFIDELKK